MPRFLVLVFELSIYCQGKVKNKTNHYSLSFLFANYPLCEKKNCPQFLFLSPHDDCVAYKASIIVLKNRPQFGFPLGTDHP